VYFIFLSDGRAPKRCEARGNLPPPLYLTLSAGLPADNIVTTSEHYPITSCTKL